MSMTIKIEKLKLVFLLEKAGKSVAEISSLMNITRQTVYNLKKRYDLIPPVDKSSLTLKAKEINI